MNDSICPIVSGGPKQSGEIRTSYISRQASFTELSAFVQIDVCLHDAAELRPPYNMPDIDTGM